MKHTIRHLLLFFALMIAGTGNVWAISESDIIINVQPNSAAGTVTISGISGSTVTISAVPASGYTIDKNHILVEKMVNPSARRRTPGLADNIEVIGSDNTYSFTIPSDYAGAYVTVTFFKAVASDFEAITSLSEITDLTKNYQLIADVDASLSSSLGAFTGKLDGGFHKIYNLSVPLFSSTSGDAVIRNVIFEDVNITSGDSDGDAGAVTSKASGNTRIYNCGILATTAEYDNDGNITGFSGSSVSGTRYVGGLVGFLDGEARVINCYSYANITGGTKVGGIVGYNNIATTSANLKTMVMNCMFYGDITGGTNKAPIYNGEPITNRGDNSGVGNYNYFSAEASYVQNRDIQTYNCALLAETRFLQRFEFFRHLLNGHRELAAWWVTGDRADKDLMAKWVMEPSQIGSNYPFPILKTPGYYPSVVNLDADNAPTTTERNKGGKLGTLTVNIQMGDGEVFNHPGTGDDEAKITTSQLTLNITDKDPDHFNFNYYKVQLPYYNDVGTKNYTGNRVVTGWKIVNIVGGTAGSLTTGADVTFKTDGSIDKMPYNFADRKCTAKDLYSNSNKRVFNQGAYWDVPEGVTSITIEPYWAKAAYLADANADVVYNQGMTTRYDVPNVGGGQIYTNGSSYEINGDDQIVYTSISNALGTSALNPNGSHTVHDYAIVLVNNYHQYSSANGGITNGKIPYTVTSIDKDGDNESDYCFMLRFDGRTQFHPVKYDFINLVGLGMAQKSDGGTGTYNFGIPQPKYWFEVTNTALFRVTQMEFDTNGRNAAPYILHGGVIEQWVSGQSNGVSNQTTYYLVGGNVWFKEFHIGCHIDKTFPTKHPPVSVTGGEFDAFYLTGLYSNAGNYDDNAECYINGGRFGMLAGTGMEGIGNNSTHANGHITWQIDNADINTFYGGGINAAKPAEGNINTIISNSHVDVFCGGPQFGDMNSGRTVKTTATGCTFGTFFGAGYGGNSYYTAAPGNLSSVDKDPWNTGDKGFNLDWDKWVKGEIKSKSVNSGNYADGTKYTGYNQDYIGAFGGVSSGISYEFLPVSGNTTNVARLFLKFVKFSLATTHSVTSTLTDCIITGNFYGGGSLGKVDGDVTSTLTDCKVHGNVFGAGFSAELPTVDVMKTGGFKKQPYYDKNLGVYLPGEYKESDTYVWKHSNTVNSTETAIDKENHILYTNEDLTTLGTVTGNATLTIEGTTTVGESIYGGGEESAVEGDTYVTVNGGSVGVGSTGLFGYRWGNVYGGGKGKITIQNDGSSVLSVNSIADLDAGLVKGNTNIEINGTPETTQILHNVYGGGAIGSVGKFTRDPAGKPTACTANTGLATVTINGGKIGHNHKDTGMVNGSSRGWEGNPDGEGVFAFLNQLAWVNNTNVIIGDPQSDEEDQGPSIFGSVYGGGENGHNFENSVVTMHKGNVGFEEGTWDCGNVYGAGCGTDTFSKDDNGNGEIEEDEKNHHNPMAGCVRGTTTITVNGGHVLSNVYGGGSMGSVGTDDDADSGTTTITINGGTIGVDGNNDGNVYGGPKGDIDDTEVISHARETEVNIKTGANILGSVFGGGEAGVIKGNVKVKIEGGMITKDVYGGGALADTNIETGNNPTPTTTVTLTGGTIGRNVYGGGLGRIAVDGEGGVSGIPAKVYGDVSVTLNGTATAGEGGTTLYNDNCVVKGSIFGCNNLNGSPQGNVTVHIYKTQGWEGHSGTLSTDLDSKDTNKHSYHLEAVYGGGNMAAYEPINALSTDEATKASAHTNVIIDGCELTSIRQVYGGGNAASTPATSVTVNGTYEIEEVFGGGNGKDKITVNNVEKDNPGANVGFYDYSLVENTYNTKELRQGDDFVNNYTYGSGKASVNIYGGTIHRVFGGSNTKGNVRQTAVTMLEEAGGCDFCVDEAYGGGKSAEMDAEAKLMMACIPGLDAAYGGAEAADIRGNVTLNITNGTFDRVFGGNNLSGTISGSITVNIEEIGCRPIIIGELYGGGNQAGYSVYGYKEVTEGEGAAAKKVWKPRESATDSGTGPETPYADPQVNVKSFTSIGTIYGGGYGTPAIMVGNPVVNINEVLGTPENYPATGGGFGATGYEGRTMSIDGYSVTLPDHQRGEIGAIYQVFGGGNAAKVIGNTHVNIGTEEEVYVTVNDKNITVGTTPVSNYYTRSGNGTQASPYTYTKASSETAQEGKTYYEKKAVKGVDIRDNVYGGGNNAEVTGDTDVQIGRKKITE